MSDAPAFTLRPATPDDADDLLRWRNDPATRRASLSTAPVDEATHRAWLARRLADPACRLFVVEHEGRAVGQLRLDLDEERGEVEVSIGLAAEARGRGLGTEVIAALPDVLAAVPWPAAATLVAQVRPENEASLRAFRAGGFAPVPVSARPGGPEDEVATTLVRPVPGRAGGPNDDGGE